MGSLQFVVPCMVVSGGNRISPISSRGNSYGRRRLVVSCEGGGIDRRNLLMGLGGLYGGLISSSDPKAVAEPIPVPDLTKCGVTIISKAGGVKVPVEDKCCAPPSENVIEPYVLPTVLNMRRRKAAHRLDKESIAKYEEGIRLMKKLDIDDPDDPRGFKQQAMIHCAYCNESYSDDSEAGQLQKRKISVHGSWLFFPFHRWYLYFFERILGHLLEDPDFALPYWNWDHRDGMTMPPMFETNKDSPLYDENRDQNLIPPAILNLASKDNSITDEQKISNNLSMIHSEMIGGVRYPIDFMGQPYRAGDPFPSPMRGGTSERGSHTGVHRWVGNPNNTHNEDMGSFHSAGRDPLFYSHHANVDRMWTIWRNQLDTGVPRNINDPDFLNSSFLFYDENKQLRTVTVADCLDNTKLGYTYEYSDINPWSDFSLKREGPRANFKGLAEHAEKDVTYPITLHDTRRIVVKKSVKGKADELLVLENIRGDPTKDITFHVFVNNDNDNLLTLDRAEYAGISSQLASTAPHSEEEQGTLTISLKELYDNIKIGDEDDKVVVTLHPVENGGELKIGGIKIIQALPKAA